MLLVFVFLNNVLENMHFNIYQGVQLCKINQKIGTLKLDNPSMKIIKTNNITGCFIYENNISLHIHFPQLSTAGIHHKVIYCVWVLL